jgi:ABC-type transport system involved in multi-copper enzyme maturation permease subunit
MTALARLEVAGVLRARLLVASAGASALLVLLFVVLAARESSVVVFTGFGRVLTGLGLAALLLVPLLSLFATVLSVVAARQQGVLEWYLSHPVSRDAVFWSMWWPRALAAGGPLLAAVAGIGVASAVFGAPVPLAALLQLAAILVGQVACFAAIGAWLSVTAPSLEQALLRGIGVWMACTALLDFALIGAMLRWQIPPHAVFALSALNPVQAGRLGLLSGADPDLGVLGPVGTWLTTTLGPTGTLTYALGWPILAAGLALFAARRAFVRRDLL